MTAQEQAQEPEAPTLTIAEAAALLDVHAATVRRYIREGRIPAHKVDGPYGPQWCIYRADAEALAQGALSAQGSLNQSDSRAAAEVADRLAQIESTVRTGLAEVAAAQKALAPAPEEAQARAEQAQRVEIALGGTVEKLVALAADNERLRARADRAEAEAATLRDELTRERERAKRPWWRQIFAGHRGDV